MTAQQVHLHLAAADLALPLSVFSEDKEDIQLLIADTIFLHDIFNEEALRVKCSILYKKDKRSIAKSTYDNFCKQYKSLLGTDYKISFSTIVTSKTTS